MLKGRSSSRWRRVGAESAHVRWPMRVPIGADSSFVGSRSGRERMRARLQALAPRSRTLGKLRLISCRHGQMARWKHCQICEVFTYEQALGQSGGNLISHIIDLSTLLHILSSTLLLKILGVGIEDLEGRRIWRLASIAPCLNCCKWSHKRPRLKCSSANCSIAKNWPYRCYWLHNYNMSLEVQPEPRRAQRFE